MGLGTRYALGRNAKVMARVQDIAGGQFAVYNAPSTASPGDNYTAMRILSGAIKANEDRKMRLDTRISRSHIERIQGRLSAEAELSFYLTPRGGTTPPDFAPMLQGAFGVQAVQGGGIDWTLSATQEGPASLDLNIEYNEVQQLAVTGWVIEDFTINIPGADEPTIDFAGPAIRHIITGFCDGPAAGIFASATTFQVNPISDFRKIAIGSRLQFRDTQASAPEDNSGAGYLVTDVDQVTGTITIAPGIVNAVGANALVEPYTPYDETNVGGLVAPAILGEITVDGRNDLLLQSASINVKNNWLAIDEVAFKYTTQDFIPGRRLVTGEMMFWGRRPDIIRFADAQYYKNQANTDLNKKVVQIVLGETATGRPQFVIDMPAVHFDFGDFEVPTEEEGTFTLPFTALSTTNSAEDEISLRSQDSAGGNEQFTPFGPGIT